MFLTWPRSGFFLFIVVLVLDGRGSEYLWPTALPPNSGWSFCGGGHVTWVCMAWCYWMLWVVCVYICSGCGCQTKLQFILKEWLCYSWSQCKIILSCLEHNSSCTKKINGPLIGEQAVDIFFQFIVSLGEESQYWACKILCKWEWAWSREELRAVAKITYCTSSTPVFLLHVHGRFARKGLFGWVCAMKICSLNSFHGRFRQSIAHFLALALGYQLTVSFFSFHLPLWMIYACVHHIAGMIFSIQIQLHKGWFQSYGMVDLFELLVWL